MFVYVPSVIFLWVIRSVFGLVLQEAETQHLVIELIMKYLRLENPYPGLGTALKMKRKLCFLI